VCVNDFQARIVLERRRFLKNAETAVQRQAMWSNLAHEMTAEFRGLCAEEVRRYFLVRGTPFSCLVIMAY